MDARHLPARLFSQQQARELDRLAIEGGLPEAELMRRAGQAAFELIGERWPEAKRLLVVCGGGNNGGDGYVVARLALEAGKVVYLLPTKPAAELKGAARSMAEEVLGSAGLHLLEASDDLELPPVDLIVDGLLGIGISGEVRAASARLIEKINRHAAPVLALDLPSGLNGDTGAVAGAAVKACATLTFIGVKKGLLTGQGPALAGELLLDELGLPASLLESLEPAAKRVTQQELRAALPHRSPSAHKGQFGHLLLIGGDNGMGGAIIMAAQAALRCGAGRVSVATRSAHVTPLLCRQPEVMVHALESADELPPLLEAATTLVIGPGLGRGDWGRELLAQLLACDKPQLLDADALNLLAKSDDIPAHEQRVITPHPGEAARLLGSSVAAVERDRFASVASLERLVGGVALLKGAGSLIAAHGQPTQLVAAGSPGMASGGMGDVLSGIIGALMAQRLSPFDATRLGALLHALAADRVATRQGERGLLASDLLAELPPLINGLV